MEVNVFSTTVYGVRNKESGVISKTSIPAGLNDLPDNIATELVDGGMAELKSDVPVPAEPVAATPFENKPLAEGEKVIEESQEIDLGQQESLLGGAE